MPDAAAAGGDAPAGDDRRDREARDDREAKVAFHLALRARGVRDLAVLRAMERVPRAAFLDPAHAALAARDLPVPLAGGQTASPAWLVARMIEAAGIAPGQRVLQLGAGSGYATAILARLGAEVTALERVRGLAERAAARLAASETAATVAWADGTAPGAAEDTFDRILVHACCEALPLALLVRLAAGGALVCARPAPGGQEVVRIAAASDGARGAHAAWRETPVCPCRLGPLRPGLSGLR